MLCEEILTGDDPPKVDDATGKKSAQAGEEDRTRFDGPSVCYCNEARSERRLFLVLLGQSESEFPHLSAALGVVKNPPVSVLRQEVKRRTNLLPLAARVAPANMNRMQLHRWLDQNPIHLEEEEKMYFQKELEDLVAHLGIVAATTSPEEPKRDNRLSEPMRKVIATALRRSAILKAVKHLGYHALSPEEEEEEENKGVDAALQRDENQKERITAN